MTDDMKRLAKEMMQRDSETAGYTKPTPLITVPNADSVPLSEQEAGLVVSITFMSRSDSTRPHVVSVGYDGVAWCTCRAKTPCWGIKAFCRVTGRPVYP